MRKALPYLVCILLIQSCINKNRLPDLRESYDYKDTKPFGTYAARKVLETSFPNTKVTTTNRAFSKTYEEVSDTNSVYFSVSRNLYMNEEDAQAMLDFVYEGNTLFLSAANFDTVLLSKLMCEQVKADALFDYIGMNYLSTKTTLDPQVAEKGNRFEYYYKPFANHFSSIRANYSKVISYNQAEKPNGFILFWGKGRLIIHCDPRAFSNYFLLKNNNFIYLQQILGLMRGSPDKIYWDDFYNTQNVRRKDKSDFSTLSELMKYPPLAIAFWIFIALLALYVLFNSKRRQRIIPVVKPNENSSIAFTETIARLYLQHHDNKNIAEKMITYFNEYIRKNYFLNVNTSSSDFISVLSRKSGVSFEDTKKLFEYINEMNARDYINDQQLLTLNNYIQHFFKNRT